MYLKESFFPDCLKISSVVPLFQNIGERSTSKNYHPNTLLAVVKIFEKLVNNRIVDLLQKCGIFPISGMVLSFLDQLQIFRQLYLIQLVWFVICKAFGRVSYAGLLHKLRYYGILGHIFGLISSFINNR